MRVDVVAILEASWQLLDDGGGIWPWVFAGMTSLEGFDQSLADTVFSGLRTGVRHGTRFSVVAKSMVSAAA
jgi:hypothetical protein